MSNSSFDEIIEDFEFLDDWEDRYRYIIELGKKMSPLESALKVASTKVDGCASQVWIVPKISGSGWNLMIVPLLLFVSPIFVTGPRGMPREKLCS